MENDRTPAVDAPDETVVTWAEAIIGPFRVVSRHAHDHGYSQLWRLQTTADNLFFWLKCHRYPNKWAGEVHALTHWASGFGLSPKVLGWRASRRSPCC
jgi:hypothetical protein